jgi:hypothetical protein
MVLGQGQQFPIAQSRIATQDRCAMRVGEMRSHNQV